MTTTSIEAGWTSAFQMEAGIAGFPEARRFVVAPWGEEGSPFSLVHFVGTPASGPDFVVVAPPAFFPGYQCHIDNDVAERLGLGDADDALVLAIVDPGQGANDTTANLLAPIVINVRTGRAAQVVLSSSEYGLRVPLRGV